MNAQRPLKNHNHQQQSNKTFKFLVLIVALAFYLRVIGVWHGLPYVLNLHEAACLEKILRVPFLLNVLEIDPTSIYTPLRFVSVLFGVGSVVLVYLIGKRLNILCALFSSTFLAVSFVHVKYSQLFIGASWLTFFTLLLIYFVLKDFSKFKSFLLFFVIFFFSFGLASLKSYINSYYLYHSSSYLLHLFNFLITGVGPVIWISALFIIRYKNNYDQNILKVIFLPPFIYFGFLGLFHLTSPSYTVLLSPFVCLSSGIVFSELYSGWKENDKKFIFLVLILLAIYIPLKYTLRYNQLMSLSDTRVLASEWIKENASGDYKLAYDKHSLQLNWYEPYSKKVLKSLVPDVDVLVNRQRFKIDQKLLSKKDWFKILKKKVDYAVINSFDSETVLRVPDKNPKKGYYKKLLKRKAEIIFDPYLAEVGKNIRHMPPGELYSPYETIWKRERGGPVVRIYKL